MVPIVLNGDYPIVLPKYRADMPHWNLATGWEKPRLQAMHARIGPGDVVYDVGAEEGEMSALYQMWGAKVFLFEPNPKVWRSIRDIWEANQLDPPMSWQGFVSNVTRTLGHEITRGFPPCTDETFDGEHGFKELHLEADNYPQIRLDDVVAAGHGPPTIITFDVEGSEFEVVKGAEQTIRTHKPTIFASIHPEYMFHQFGDYSRELRGWIMEFGYHETIIDYQHELHCQYEPL